MKYIFVLEPFTKKHIYIKWNIRMSSCIQNSTCIQNLLREPSSIFNQLIVYIIIVHHKYRFFITKWTIFCDSSTTNFGIGESRPNNANIDCQIYPYLCDVWNLLWIVQRPTFSYMTQRYHLPLLPSQALPMMWTPTWDFIFRPNVISLRLSTPMLPNNYYLFCT